MDYKLTSHRLHNMRKAKQDKMLRRDWQTQFMCFACTQPFNHISQGSRKIFKQVVIQVKTSSMCSAGPHNSFCPERRQLVFKTLIMISIASNDLHVQLYLCPVLLSFGRNLSSISNLPDTLIISALRGQSNTPMIIPFWHSLLLYTLCYKNLDFLI